MVESQEERKGRSGAVGRRWKLAAVVIALVAACVSNQEIAERVADKVMQNCYQADKIVATENGEGDIGVGSGGDPVKLKVKGGHTVYIEGLKPANKTPQGQSHGSSSVGNVVAGLLDKTRGALGLVASAPLAPAPNPVPAIPQLRPVVAVALDPTYAGGNDIELAGVDMGIDGRSVSLFADANALAELNAQQPANWKLLAARSSLGVASGGSGLRVDFGWARSVALTPGQPAQSATPILFASRMKDGDPFEILSVTVDEPPFASLVAAPEPSSSDVDADGHISVPEGSDLTLSSIRVWNDTPSAASGTVVLRGCQGASCLDLASTPFTVAGFNEAVLSGPTLPTSGLHQGAYELAVEVDDTTGAVVSSSRSPLRVTGPDPVVPFTGVQHQISLSAGGQVDLWIGAEASAAGAPYTVYLSGTGGIPGTDLGDVFVPLVADAWTQFGVSLLGTPSFPGGQGNLDANGFAKASFIVSPGTDPSLAGTTLYFAPLVSGSPRLSSSAPWVVKLVP